MSAFKTIQKHYKQRDLTAREWKERGGKVVGYFCDSVPEEMILAAGLFPFRITGEPSGSTKEIEKYLEPFYEGFIYSSLNMLLTGGYDFLDFVVIPRSRETVAAQYAHLSQIKELDPVVKLPELYPFDFIHTRSHMSGLYNLDRVRDLKKKLEEWSGKEISQESLSRAITIGNENKLLLKKVAALRAAEPPRISGVEALQIIGSSMFMLKKDHNKLLRQYLEAAERLPAKDGARLFVEGSPIDNLQFYELVESCNAIIVGEDNCWGNRYSDNPVDQSIDPLEAIAERYHHKSPCPWVYPVDIRVEYCLRQAMEAKAQGVIFYILEWDCLQWDYPDQREALEEKGIPTLLLKNQKYLLSESERLRTSIGKFIKAI